MRVQITVLMAVCLGLWACPAGEKTASKSAAQKSETKPVDKTATAKPVEAKTPPKPKTIPAPEDVAAPPKDATKTKSGLASKVLKPGTGTEHPTATDSVRVHYTGWTTDGKMFDSSVTRGQPIMFRLNAVIPGWTEGVQLMTKGEKRRFWIPEELAYKGNPNAPQGMLVFDVELLEIVKPPEAPKDVAAPPKDAQKTKSGLASKLIQAGTGDKNPRSYDVVEVHYSGWTTDGKMFDSSVTRGRPAKFALNRVIAGWTEGVQLMKVGEKRRFWIPEEIAYQGRPGAPKGMLVFDIELLSIAEGKKPIPAPANVAAPPKDATTTKTGLKYTVLTKGKGKNKPKATDKVKVHYTGWTTDGKMFDSSVQRGVPATFPVGRVIAGWTEMLQLMTPGEKVRAWIPQDLAYKGRPGAPQGMLVFDIELLDIVETAPPPPPAPPTK